MISLRRQLTWLLLLYGPGLLAVGFLLLFLLVRTEMYEQFDESLLTAARVIAEEIGDEIQGSDSMTLREELGELEANALVPPYFEVTAIDGKPIASSNAIEVDPPARLLGTEPVFGKAGSVALPNGKPGRLLTKRFEGHVRPFLVTVMADRSELDQTLKAAALLFALSGTGMVGIAFVTVPWFLRRILRPLAFLNRGIGGIDARSLHTRLSLDGLPLELRPVVERFNEMLARLDESFARERRVNADLAHELRTPIAELKLLAETALKWPANRPAALDADVLEISRNMESMTERMLMLARNESEQIRGEFDAFALDPLLRRACEDLGRKATARDLRFDLRLAPVQWIGDATLTRSMVTNLLENAVAYAPPGSAIGVELVPVGEQSAQCRISNAAPDLSAEDFARLGERYWRKSTAREGDGAHFGLGLPIVLSLAPSAGLEFDFERSAEGAFVAILTGQCPVSNNEDPPR